MIVSDLPLERRADFSQFVVEISTKMNDTTIASILSHWLSPSLQKEREKRARLGQQYILRHNTYDTFVDLFLLAWENYTMKNRRGVMYTYPFERGCYPMDNSGDPSAYSIYCPGGTGIPKKDICTCGNLGKSIYMIVGSVAL